MTCISKATLNWCLREMSEVKYFSEDLRRNWKKRSEQTSGSGIEVVAGKRIVLLDPFSPLVVGSYKW